MKLLPSPSISSSSTTSFDSNMFTSKSAPVSCLTGIFRRILWFRTPPTHPSYQITETSSILCDNNHQEFTTSNEKSEATVTPGIVARLMGLESLPDTRLVNVQTSICSISRSRSMNSVEFGDEGDQKEGRHRRVKSTLPFCEMPTFLELENEEFFVLSFKNKVVGSKGRNCEVGFGELKEKRREKCKTKENRREKVTLEKKEDEEIIDKRVLRVLSEKELNERSSDKHIQNKIEDTTKTTTHLKESNQSKPRKNKNIKRSASKNEEAKCSSEDSSPVSVLDFDQLINDREVPTSAEKNTTKSGECNPRRKLSPELDNYSYISQCRNDTSISEIDCSRRRIEQTCGRSKKNVQDYLNPWGEICKFSEPQEVAKIWRFEDFEETTADIAREIVDHLLEEFVDQFA